MVLALAFEAYYVGDTFLAEVSSSAPCWSSSPAQSAILNQIDITTDGFGFMLAFGDLVWLPFTYGVPVRYLVFTPKDLSLPMVAATIAVFGTGLYIFRTANSEKHHFRNGHNPKSEWNPACGLSATQRTGHADSYTDLRSMQTKRGTKLLTSGWWGRSRHPVSPTSHLAWVVPESPS